MGNEVRIFATETNGSLVDTGVSSHNAYILVFKTGENECKLSILSLSQR